MSICWSDNVSVRPYQIAGQKTQHESLRWNWFMCLPAFQTFCWSGPSSFRLHRLSKRESPLPPRFQARSRCSNRSSKISSSHISVCQAPSGQLEQCSQQIWWWNWCHGTRRSFVPWRHPTNQQQRSELSYTGKPGVPCKVNDPGNLSKLKLKTPQVAKEMCTWLLTLRMRKNVLNAHQMFNLKLYMFMEGSKGTIKLCYTIREIQYMLKFSARVQGTI